MKRILAFLTLLSTSALAEGHPEVAAVSTSGTTARSAKLGPGYKLIYCSAATHFATGNSAVTATTADLTIPATTAVTVLVDGTEPYVAFILDDSTGTCSIYTRNSRPGSVPPVFAATGGANVDGLAISPLSINASASIIATTNLIAGEQLAVGFAHPNYLQLSGGDEGTAGITAYGANTSIVLSPSGAGAVYVAGNYRCAGTGTCSLESDVGQNMAMDCGGGTCTASLGTGTATTTVAGRSGQTTNLNGNVTFGTAGPNLGSTVTGAWSVYATGLLVAATTYGAFQISQSATNVKFRNVSCAHGVAGSSTNGTLAVRNVTDGTNLCTGSYTCTTAANTPTLIFDCNSTPTVGKMYALDFTTGCGITQVSGLSCNVEIAH